MSKSNFVITRQVKANLMNNLLRNLVGDMEF